MNILGKLFHRFRKREPDIVVQEGSTDSNEGVWCVVANIKKEHKFGEGGKETRIGTRQFRGGTKVYISGCYPGTCDSVVAIGLHRKSRKFIECVVNVKYVENLRPKCVYHPRVLDIIRRKERCWIVTKEEAEKYTSVFLEWQEMWAS